MPGLLQHFIRCQHFGFEAELLPEFLVVNFGIASGDNQHGGLAFTLKGKALRDARGNDADGSGGLVNCGAGCCEFHDIVLSSEGTEMGFYLLDGHGFNSPLNNMLTNQA
ncbi:hypothetical protein D3C71_1722510 [compost metagenome]